MNPVTLEIRKNAFTVIPVEMGLLTSHLGIRLENDECIAIFDRAAKMPNERE